MNCALTRAFILFGFIFLLLPKSHAQSVYVGGGAYFGQGACAGGVAIPREIKKIEDLQKKNAKELREAEKALGKAEKEAERASGDLDKYKKKLESWLKPHVASGVMLHASTGGRTVILPPGEVCDSETKDLKKEVADLGNEKPWPKFCEYDGSGYSSEAQSWGSKAQAGGTFDEGLCYSENFVDLTKNNNKVALDAIISKNTHYSGANNRAQDCKDAASKYAEALGRKSLADVELARLNDLVKYLSDQAEEYQDEKDYAVEDWQDRQAEGKTAADFCYTCQYGGREVKTSDKILGLTGTLLGAAATYYGVKYVADQNKEMGWPTSPWMAYAMGYPFVMAGIYGAAYGGGAGAFGCSPGGAGYPAFGYPGGGMYPGAYPGGGYPGAYPAMGYPAAGGIGMAGYPAMGYPAAGGIAMGYPAMGMPAMGMMVGGAGIGMMGYPAMGMPAMGYPAMGMPAMGMMVGGAGIGMMGYPAMGMPAMGYPAAGMAPLAGGYMGMAMGYPAMGMPAMGMAVGGIGMMGYPAMGMPAMGGMGMGMAGYPAMGYPAMGMPAMGYPAGGGMMMGSMAAMQYQQQLLQMQQQQMAQWMQEQQRMQQDYMNRQQMVGRLTQELSRIQMQIQMISTGAYGGGSYGGAYGYGGGGYGTGGYPTGNSYDPNSDPNFNNNPYNGPSRGQGYQIPPRGN